MFKIYLIFFVVRKELTFIQFVDFLVVLFSFMI